MKLVKNDQWSHLLYALLFLLITMVMVYPFIHTGKIQAVADWEFHAARVEQIYRNLSSGHLFTFIASSTFHHTGVGSFMFYPTVFLYPWAAMRLFVKPVTAFYLWYFLITYLAFLVAFYSMNKFKQNRHLAFIFSLVYVLNTYRLFLGQFVFGEFIAASFLPLVFLGFYQLFFAPTKAENVRWITLAVGMTLLTYSHVLSVIITLEIFALVLVLTCCAGKAALIFAKWQSLLKAVGLWGILSLPIICLFISNYIGKKVSAAISGIAMALVPSMADLVTNSLNNGLNIGIGLVLLATVLVGWYFARDNQTDLVIYLLGIVLFVVASGVFPWGLLGHTPLGVVQLPYRYLSFSCLFLAVIAAKGILLLINRLSFNWPLAAILLLCIGVIGFLSAEKSLLHELRTAAPSVINVPKKGTEVFPKENKILDNNNYDKQFQYSAIYGEADYYPRKALDHRESIINQIAYVNGRPRHVNASGSANKIKVDFQVRQPRTSINLPVLAYEGTTVQVNDKKVPKYVSDRGTVLLKNLQPGKAKVVVGFNPGIGFYGAVLVSLLGWCGLVYAYWQRRFKAARDDER